MTKKSHIYSLGKHTSSRGCTKPQECYQITASCLIKPLKNVKEGFSKQSHTKDISLDIKKVILLDNCYKIDLFYNSYLVENITNSENMTANGNIVTISVTHKETVNGYK